MAEKLFKVGGISNNVGGYKVRFANDMVRVKVLGKTGADVQLLELPSEMTKAQVVTFLKTSELYANPVYKEAIDNADAKYNPAPKVAKVKAEKPAKVAKAAKAVKVKATKPSLDAIKARKPKVAKAVVAEDAAETVAPEATL